MIRYPSPNFGERRGGVLPALVVLHYTAMERAEAARDWLCNPEAEVSAHYVIARDGTVWHLVEEAMRAWHAGAGSWAGQGDVNSRSVGIELANNGFEPFPEPQMAALEELLGGIMSRWDIPPQGVIGHSDMAPGRKIDPGARFDWRRLAHQGMSVWPGEGVSSGPGGLSSTPSFLDDLAQFGYPGDQPEEVLLAVFRSRFRPGANGPLDDVDQHIARDLASRFFVDGPPPSA